MWLLEGLVIEKRPSSLVVTPCPVFIQNTLAPGIASPVLSFTVPRTCAYILPANNRNSPIIIYFILSKVTFEIQN